MCLKNRGGFSEAQTTAHPPKGTSPSAVSNAEVLMRQHGDSTATQLIFWRFAYIESRAAVLSSAPTAEQLRNYRYRLSLTQQSQSHNQICLIIVSSFCLEKPLKPKNTFKHNLSHCSAASLYQVIPFAWKSPKTPSNFDSLLKHKHHPHPLPYSLPTSYPKQKTLAPKTPHEYIRKWMKSQEL